MVFILVALDKVHHSRGPQLLSNHGALNLGGDRPVTVAMFDIVRNHDAEQDVARDDSPEPFQRAGDDESATECTRLRGEESPGFE